MEQALKVMQDAVDSISHGRGRSLEALKEVLAEVCRLRAFQFPVELQNDFLHFLDSVHYDWRLAWKSHEERMHRVSEHIDSLSHEECIRVTFSLFKLESELRTAVITKPSSLM